MPLPVDTNGCAVHSHLSHILQITWIDGSENVLTEGVEYVKEPSSSDTRRFTAKSILKLKANKDYHNKTIICQAQNSVDKTYRSAAIRLDVRCIYIKIIILCFHQPDCVHLHRSCPNLIFASIRYQEKGTSK